MLDEVQRVPELLSYLQGIIDDDPAPGKWVLSGSQNLTLLEAVSQSLAGRTAMHQLLPLSWDEVRRFRRFPAGLEEAVFTGGYPRIHDQELQPSDWLRSYVGTYVERDVRSISNIGDLTAFQRFVMLCAGRTAQLLNYSSLAGDCGISQPTAKAWFSVLEASFIAFRLPAFHANIRKRLVRMPKLHFYDTGLACWLLGIREPDQLRLHPLRGSLFETWVVTEVLKHRTNHGSDMGMSSYRDSHGAEIDLIIDEPDILTLIEAKSAATPSSSLSARARRARPALDALRPRCDLAVVYGGSEFRQQAGFRLVPWRMVRAAVSPALAPTVQVVAGGHPVPSAQVVVFLPGGIRKLGRSDPAGQVQFDLGCNHRSLTVFVARDGFAAHVETDWVPHERTLHVRLAEQPTGGSCVATASGSGDQPEVRVSGRAVAVRPLEGAVGVLEPCQPEESNALGPDGGQRKRSYVKVVRVVGDCVLLNYYSANTLT